MPASWSAKAGKTQPPIGDMDPRSTRADRTGVVDVIVRTRVEVTKTQVLPRTWW